MFTPKLYLPGLGLALIIASIAVHAQDQQPALGSVISESDLTGFDLIATPSGDGFPAGSGNAIQGREVFSRRCAACHGSNGEGTSGNTILVGGDMQSTDTPLRTVGSYWPHASTLLDYIRRAMPADAPKSLSNDEVYQVTAFLLFSNGVIAEDTLLNRSSLTEVRMPNAEGFIDQSDLH